MPAPSRLRTVSGPSPRQSPPLAVTMPATPAPAPRRRPGLRWRLEAASRLLIEDWWSAWAIAGWLRDSWPEASPAAAVARWLEETTP